MNRNAFTNLVRRILREETTKRVPEMDGNGRDADSAPDKTKTFASDPNPRDAKTKDEMVDELAKAVKGVDSSFTVVWDDHDDLMVNGRDKTFARITPLWEDNFKIILMPRNEDRYFFTGLTWKQVLDFVKDNLTGNHTGVEKGRDKAWRNSECQTPAPDKGMPQKDKPKTMSTDEAFTKEKNKEKRYTEDQVKEEKDLPNMPLREVEKIVKQLTHKVKPPVRLRRRTPNTQLVAKQK